MRWIRICHPNGPPNVHYKPPTTIERDELVGTENEMGPCIGRPRTLFVSHCEARRRGLEEQDDCDPNTGVHPARFDPPHAREREPGPFNFNSNEKKKSLKKSLIHQKKGKGRQRFGSHCCHTHRHKPDVGILFFLFKISRKQSLMP